MMLTAAWIIAASMTSIMAMDSNCTAAPFLSCESYLLSGHADAMASTLSVLTLVPIAPASP